VFQGFQDETNPAQSPNWFAPSADLFFILHASLLTNQFPVVYKNKTIVEKCMDWMMGDNPASSRLEADECNRPLNKNLDSYKDVEYILNTHFKSYKTRGSGKILTVTDVSTARDYGSDSALLSGPTKAAAPPPDKKNPRPVTRERRQQTRTLDDGLEWFDAPPPHDLASGWEL
jgi:hypothetical protein